MTHVNQNCLKCLTKSIFVGDEAAVAAVARPKEGPRKRALLMDKKVKKVGASNIRNWKTSKKEFVSAWRQEAGKNVSMKTQIAF